MFRIVPRTVSVVAQISLYKLKPIHTGTFANIGNQPPYVTEKMAIDTAWNYKTRPALKLKCYHFDEIFGAASDENFVEMTLPFERGISIIRLSYSLKTVMDDNLMTWIGTFEEKHLAPSLIRFMRIGVLSVK